MEVETQRKSIIRGIRIFVFLTILGICLVFYLTSSEKTWGVLKELKFSYFLLASILIVVDLFSGAARIHIFIRRIIPKGFWACFKANLANIFLAAATPFQTGGGIAQLYVLKRHKVPYAAGMTVGLLNLVATLSFLFFTAVVVLNTIPSKLTESKSLLMILDISRFVFYFILLLTFLFILRPGGFGKFVKWFSGFLSHTIPSRQEMFQKWNRNILDFLQRYQEYLKYYWRKEKLTLLLNYVLTIILYFNKCLVAYVILLGLGVSVNFWDVIMAQMLVIFFLYFAPTPGASFIAETGMSAVMSRVIPVYTVSIFMVLWRFFTTYFGVLLGSIVLLKTIADTDKK
jgi:uncharacterized protein (TIRG00374 family)